MKAINNKTSFLRYLVLLTISIFTLQINIAQANHTPTLAFKTKELPGKYFHFIAKAHSQAYDKTLKCTYLKFYHPNLRKDLLNKFRTETITYTFKDYDPDYPGECAYTYPGWFGQNKIRLKNLAFTKLCGKLSSVIFHEMIHLAWTWGSEKEVSHIENLCYQH